MDRRRRSWLAFVGFLVVPAVSLATTTGTRRATFDEHATSLIASPYFGPWEGTLLLTSIHDTIGVILALVVAVAVSYVTFMGLVRRPGQLGPE